MQPGRRADRPELGQVPPERRQQDVPARPVDRPQPAKVAVELAVGQEIGERELVDGGRPEVGRLLGRGDLVGQLGGTTIQPSRRPGARILLADPAYTTRSGDRPCIAPIGSRS